MLIDNPPNPLLRIHHPEQVDLLLAWTAQVCGLGAVHGHTVCESGYDDCNLTVVTERGRFLVKVFTTARPAHLTRRYVDVLECVLRAGVSHPALHGPPGGHLLHHPASGNQLVVMDHLDHGDFLERGEHPNDAQLDDLMRQVCRVHAVEREFPAVHDWWATPNIAALARDVLPLLDDDDRGRVSGAVELFARLDLATLPHALVHGDLTKANVIPTSDHTVAVIDFAVANRYPRVHELAMIAVNLMHGDPRGYDARLAELVRRYAVADPLSPRELDALPVYVYATAAMELLGSVRESVRKGNRSAENDYLIQLGRTAVDAAARLVDR
ncbi:phosphotransferase [Actinophytocola xanthii]|uniref:Aminoglycoside phosphotransferase domain-containing protein n=1 Tax=Actinophytocola xanthii TaxID=1912961 RepID=A0A1Q8CK08_9PSEU|nr:phosphotransferase [Actinophytocola xanthii]OLF14691.1 hypothetical protein BU204_25710 [Actinophytocola xanthii]